MKKGCSVFVCNIPFGTPEADLIKELSAAGKVKSFRMITDKATGKSKGYGFCEYENALIAEAAIRQLKISFNGRPIKINYAENDMPEKVQNESKPVQIDSLISVLDNMDPSYLRSVVDHLKKMAISQPNQLNTLFEKNPNLIFAVLEMLTRLDLADVDKLIEGSFDIKNLKEQISNRLPNIDAEFYSEDIKKRLTRIKNLIQMNK